MDTIKRPIIALAILLSWLNTLQAGNIFDNPETRRITVGVNAAYEYDSPTNISLGKSDCSLSSRSGFSVGFDINIPLWKNLYLAPGISIFESQTGVDGKDSRPISFLWFLGSRINCLLGYHFDVSDKVSLSLSTGPQLAIGFTSDSHYPGKKADDTLYTKIVTLINRYDCLWNVNIAATYKSKFTLGLGLSQGLINRVGSYYTQFDPNLCFKDRILSVSFGYIIN